MSFAFERSATRWHCSRWFKPSAVRAQPVAEFHPGAAAINLGLLMILYTAPLAAQTLTGGGARIATAEGREIIALAVPPGSQAALPSASSGFEARSRETATQRIHTVTFEGRTLSAATPLEGPGSRIAFDPDRRTFAPLLPSIRVELGEDVRIDAVAAQVGATGVTVFESLGFAIVELPDVLHPAEAAEQVSIMYGEGIASVRLRRPRIEWR